ncbi:MAG: hypothetical protein U5P41_09955 [Gammaproteobacteria bacterium]|nr:hypothetical protein [Gammaproteobacteria bacterium]
MMEVRKINDTTFDVSVTGKTTTRHRVTLSESYYKQLTAGGVSPETLLEKSFEFLLEREPNTAILAEFDLGLINRYFPEYENEIQRQLK